PDAVGFPGGLLHAGGVAEIFADATGYGWRIAKWHEYPPVVAEQLLRMPIGRGDHRLARAEYVGQRAGGDLRLVQVGGDVDVGRADELLEVVQGHEVVVED